MDSKGSTAYVTIVQALSLLVLCVVMVAGLWPFRAPRNAVSWLKSENGLRFGHHGTLISRDAFRLVSPVDQGPCSLEIWLTPESVSRGGVILAFDSSPDASTPFSLRQVGSSMAIQRYATDEQDTPHRPWLEVDGVFYERKRTQITIASGTDGTTIYVNGVLAGGSSTLGVTSRDLTGRLVVGNSTIDESWSGEISRLAIYDRELLPVEVKRHFESEIGESDSSGGDGPTALYLFNEREGTTVHNKMDPETDLLIPDHYCVLHRALFRPLWDGFNDSGAAWRRWSYWKDIAVNVAGFIPVGFLFMAYFSSVKALQRSALFVITLGFAVSFTIEALQYFLPTRDSSISDLITNTTGTAVGVVLYRLPWVQRLVCRTRQYVTSSSHVGQEGINICEPTTTRHEV
ncbi:MAG: VanZ family protein [Terriglobales bacterium]